MRKTNRGFNIESFVDDNGHKCSLQESSSFDARIWLGIDTPKIQICDQGWKEITHAVHPVTGEHIEIGPPTPEKQLLINGRMHLSQKQVKALLPYLQKFVETGYLECQ